MQRSSRRRVLATAGSALAAALAGCGGRPTARSGPHSAGSTTAVAGEAAAADEAEMVTIPAGTYTIGSEDGRPDAQPVHEVDLAAFAVDRTEVTNGAFASFLNDLGVAPAGSAPAGEVTREQFPDGKAHLFVEGPEGTEENPLVALDDEHARIGVEDGRFVVRPGYGDHPVNEVTWRGARRYAHWRGARLPTEVEWEAAARGFEARTYPWGDSPPTHEKAVYGRDSGETAPVGSHPAGATPRGVHDMAGNVSEWTSTLYRPYPYDADDGREDPTVRGERVTRGGAHVFFGPAELTTYYRTGFSREFDRGHRHIGFRCARSLGDG